MVGRFDGGRISSDGGCVLLREVEERTHILNRLAGCFVDHRDPELIEHSVESLVKQRMYGIELQLFADRTSTHAIDSNQLRLYFSSFAYVLIETLRALGLSGTELAQAQCGTTRLKLFKIGAQVRLSVRKIWIAFSEAYPYARLFQAVLDRLRQIPLTC